MNLYMHEIALQTNEDYRVSNAEALRYPIPGPGDSLTAAHISALSSCLTAIDSIFETFLSLDVATIRCLPIFNFVRVAYAVVVLIKIYFSASSPNAELGKVINKDNMKVAEYIDRLLERFRETAARDKSRPGSKFLMVLIMLRGWFQQHSQNQSRQQGDQNIDPSLKSSQTQSPQSNCVANSSKFRDNRPLSQTSQDQQHRYQPPQEKQPPEYNPANTPLQLLSEIATGNGPAQNNQNSGTPLSADVNAPVYPAWMGGGVQMPYIYDAATGMPAQAQAGGTAMMGGPANQPLALYPGGPFGGDISYLTMGDGLEQAMGLTLTGFGGGSPADSADYENTMRLMAQNDANLMGLMDGYPGNPGNAFGF